MMVMVYTFIVVAGCFYIFSHSRWIWALNQARRRGIFPERGKATMFDVRRLIIEGEIELAIEVYRWIYRTSRKKSREAVLELANSISEKNFEFE